MITVLGATGHTGREITRLLLDAGEAVRALGRSEHRLAELGRAGAETLAGEATDVAYLTRGLSRRRCRLHAAAASTRGRPATSPRRPR